MRIFALALVALAACAQDSVTAVEIHSALPTDRGITQLRISGAIGDAAAFTSGMLPEVPRTLGPNETAVILLGDSQGGRELALSVDAMAGGSVAMSKTAIVEVERGATTTVDVVFDGAGSGSGSDAGVGSDGGGSDSGSDGGNMPAEVAGFTSFTLLHSDNAKVPEDVSGAVLGSTVAVALPGAADEKMIVPSFVTAVPGTTVTVGATPQLSGATTNDFSNAVTYHLRTPSGVTRDYAVSMPKASGDKGTLFALGFATSENSQFSFDMVGTVGSSAVTVHVPAGTDVSALVPRFSALGTVVVDGYVQTSGVTAVDFSLPRSFVVTTTKGSGTWVVSVLSN